MCGQSPQATSPSRLLILQVSVPFAQRGASSPPHANYISPCFKDAMLPKGGDDTDTVTCLPLDGLLPFSSPPATWYILIHFYSAQNLPLHVAFTPRLFPLCLETRTLTFIHLLCIQHLLHTVSDPGTAGFLLQNSSAFSLALQIISLT